MTIHVCVFIYFLIYVSDGVYLVLIYVFYSFIYLLRLLCPCWGGGAVEASPGHSWRGQGMGRG